MLAQKINLFFVFGILLWSENTAIERNKIYMRRAQMEDQTASASGYIYSSDSNGPTKFIQFTDTLGNLQSPVVTLGGSQQIPALPASVYLPLKQPQFYPGFQFTPGYLKAAPVSFSVHRGIPLQAKQSLSYDTAGLQAKDNDNFVKKDGEEYESAQRSAKGEKGESGYNQVQEFQKGSKGQYGEEHQEGYNSEKGGNKQGHHESGQNYAAHNEEGKAVSGGSFGKLSKNKKGAKTTGYHKVFHKDEYKKDHSFYDEADRRGHFKKYDDHDATHGSEEGGHKKGGSSEGAHKEQNNGRTGQFDKGHYVQNDNGYKGEKGGNKYYQNHADYEKEGGQKDGKSYGFTEGQDY